MRQTVPQSSGSSRTTRRLKRCSCGSGGDPGGWRKGDYRINCIYYFHAIVASRRSVRRREGDDTVKQPNFAAFCAR
ncbi:protein of unknown function [Methanoculleus bourgensis]|uniref:Uncharacterized protein n=1 Tax=Methanoculleus bourgensis TaxID=83986 RepID=A0A0X3BIR3_9EURY|nr:protein of unknown function [Methanoculleus bourgensis]